MNFQTKTYSLKNNLQKALQVLETVHISRSIDTIQFKQRYSFINGRIEKNQYASYHNFLTINLGELDSVFSEMAVINSKGIIGITENMFQKIILEYNLF